MRYRAGGRRRPPVSQRLTPSGSDNPSTAAFPATPESHVASAWRSFEDWTQARGVPSLPAPPELVAAYLLELNEEREMSVATIRLHKAAIAAIHRSTGHEDPTDNKSFRRMTVRSVQKTGVVEHLALASLPSFGQVFNNPVQQ